VHGGLAAPGVAAVHDVVVDQRGGLEELEGRRDGHDAGRVVTARAAPAPVAEGRPQPLAAAQQVADGVHQRGELVRHAVEDVGLPGEQVVQGLVDPVAQVLGIERVDAVCGRAGGHTSRAYGQGHVPSSGRRPGSDAAPG
jgi:hypothetical protein